MAQADALLGSIRRDILIWEKAHPGTRGETEAAERISRSFAELDAHLSEGGQPPTAWMSVAEARARAIRRPDPEPPVTGSSNLMGVQPVETGAPRRSSAETEWDSSRGE